jgi:hypothetical protein
VSDRDDQERWMAFTIDDRLLGFFDAPDPDCVLVQSSADLSRLCADILGRRQRPVVAITLDMDGGPVLACGDVRAVVGPGVRIYVICDSDLLPALRDLLGSRLTVGEGAVRTWWPGADARCDPADHPCVLALEGEPSQVTLEEFAHQFDLTRPRVRAQIRLIEDARAFAEHELSLAYEHNRKVQERLRDAQIECHGLRTRAEAAEAGLTDAQQPPSVRGLRRE